MSIGHDEDVSQILNAFDAKLKVLSPEERQAVLRFLYGAITARLVDEGMAEWKQVPVVPEVGNGFRVVLPKSVPLETLDQAEKVDEDWVRDLGGFSFAAPAGEGPFWTCLLAFYEALKPLFPPGFLATRQGRELVKKKLKEFLQAVTSPGNVGADGQRTNVGKPRSNLLSESSRRAKRGEIGLEANRDLLNTQFPGFDDLPRDEQKRKWLLFRASRRARPKRASSGVEVPAGTSPRKRAKRSRRSQLGQKKSAATENREPEKYFGAPKKPDLL